MEPQETFQPLLVDQASRPSIKIVIVEAVLLSLF